ncbi:MAG TPA: type 1 glutamine amidotransferase [Geobacteraceae bacterium]
MLIIVQNDAEVPCGAYGDYLREWRVPFRVVNSHAGEALPPPEELSAAIVLGGAMGVHDTARHPALVPLKSWIAETVDREVPFLGICLGGQLLADVFGARVLSPSPFGEKGTHGVSLSNDGVGDPLFSGVPREFITFQWHNDAFEVPSGGVRLAFSAACPNQAFRFGPSAWGTQFHPEMTAELVDLWARWSPETAVRVDGLLAEFRREEGDYRSAAQKILANFLSLSKLK